MKNYIVILLSATLLGILKPVNGMAQELEPRALTNVPRGLNFFAAGYAYAKGNTLLDPAIPLEDFNGRINTIILAYVRSINFFGKSGKVDVFLPFSGGDFEGVFEGEPFTDKYTGFGDLRLRATINLTGAPSIDAKEFAAFKPRTISGLGVQVTLPTGRYIPEQLPNLGSNRLSIRATYGLSHTFNKWVVEGFVGAWFFTKNTKLLGDNTLEQRPLYVLKGNIIRSFRNQGMWLAFSTGFGYGAESFINGVRRDATISQLRLGLTYALPLHKNHILKFTAGSGIRFKQGNDYDLFALTYTYLWLDRSKQAKLAKARE